MKNLKSRGLGFLIVSLTYVFATVLGVVIFNLLDLSLWLSILLADVISTVAVFIVSVILKNASVYDPYWSVQPIVILVALCFGKSLNAVFS